MDNYYYILENKKPKVCNDIIEWGKWFNNRENKIVKQTTIQDVKVSTVFLGIDHSFIGGTPILFETMIFGGEHDDFQERYTTWEEAIEGHRKACELVVTA